jgi:cyclic pyranopterin phosphate synthase
MKTLRNSEPLPTDTPAGLTHLDASGAARMVDVGNKAVTAREAFAEGRVEMDPQTLALLLAGNLPKGEALATARVAGILAAKKCAELIPLCHTLALDAVEVAFEPQPPGAIRIVATARTSGRTGVEMEALTAVSVAALTIYDMCKAVDKAMRIEGIRLLRKSGGKQDFDLGAAG